MWDDIFNEGTKFFRPDLYLEDTDLLYRLSLGLQPRFFKGHGDKKGEQIRVETIENDSSIYVED